MSETTVIQRILSQRMLLCCSTGFASGMPLYVLYQLIPAWLRDQGVDLKTIGLFALISIPYVWKFLWAPFMDRPFFFGIGRRRGWGLLSQLLLMLLLASLSLFDPSQDISIIAGIAFCIAFCSATQDIVIDAYRREILPDEELGLGNSLFVNAYRLSSLVPGSLALVLADHYPWAISHLAVAAFMLVGITTSLLMPEPQNYPPKEHNLLKVIKEPLQEFLQRNGVKQTILILLFMLFYKLGDSMATALATPFYLDLGFTKTDIASIVKAASLWSSIVGGFLGGLIMIKIGINRSLWYFGVIQLMTILGFAALSNQSTILPITALENRSISHIEELSGATQLAQYMTEGDLVAPVYINEISAEKLLKECSELRQENLPSTLKDKLLSEEDVAPLKMKCPEITHRIRLNVASSSLLHKLFGEENKLAQKNLSTVEESHKTGAITDAQLEEARSHAEREAKQVEEDIQILNRAQSEIGIFTDVEQFNAYFSATKVELLRQQTVLKIDAKHASAEELAQIPIFIPNALLLFWVVSAEYLGVGLGTAAFVSFIARSTNKAHTAAQFALLTSLAGLPRTFAASATGYLIEAIGYTPFFLLCTLLALPGMALLWWVAPFQTKTMNNT